MKSLRALIALLGVSTLLLVEFQVYQRAQERCKSRSYQTFGDSTTGMDTLNSTRFEKKSPVSGKDLLTLFEGVERFVMFIGYPRSGHSLIGSLLDAHPEIIVSDEYNVIGKWSQLDSLPKRTIKFQLFYELFSRSETQALFGVRAPIGDKGGYYYHVPATWQGTYRRRIKVIGDKKGGSTSKIDSTELLRFFQQLEDVIKIPLKLVHIVRNPFDNIATIALRTLNERDHFRSGVSKKLNNSKTLDRSISSYFKLTRTNERVLEQRGDTVLTLRSHEIIKRPQETFQKLCDHLMVTCYQDYVEACIRILYKSISVTRNTFVWTDNQKENVLVEMQKYSFLKDYDFEHIP